MDLWLYVYGNGEFIYNILTSVNFFMHHAKSFFELAAVLSLMFFAVEATGVLPTRGYDWAKFIKIYMLISLFVLTPYPGKVNVHDVLTNQDRVFNFKDGQLPIGLIFPIAGVSSVMYRLINLYQQNFEIDENLNFSYSGMNFGANFILALDNVNSYDDKFNYNLDHYMQNCGFQLIHKAGASSELRTSKDIFTTLNNYTSAARFVQQLDFNSGTPMVKPCNQAIAEISKYYDANQDKIMNANAQMMGINTSIGFERYMNAANAATSQLLGISQGASTALKQAIAMNMIMAAVKNGAQNMGNGFLALAAYDAEQFQQYKKSSELSGAATARTVPILVGIAFALLFFLYPVMIFLAIALGSYRAIGVFFQIIVAINLIPLIYEILNYISTFYLQKKLGIVITGQGYSYDISTSIYSFTDNMIIAGNWLATTAPLLAYTIVSGSAMALTAVFSHINDPAKTQSMQVGGELARGNMQMGNASIDNASFNNMHGNKLDDQLTTNSGVALMKETTPGGIHTNAGGLNYDQNFKSDLLVTPNFAHIASTSLQNSLSHTKQEIGQLSKQWGQQSQRIQDLSNSIQSGQRGSLATGSEEYNNLQHAQALATNIQASLGAMAFKTGFTGEANSAVRDELNHNFNEYQRYSNELSHSSDQTIRDAFNTSNSLTTNSSKTIQEAISTSQALNDISSNQSSINTNFSNDFNSYLRNQGVDTTLLSASELTTAAQQFVRQKINNNYGIKNNLPQPSQDTNGITALGNFTPAKSINQNRLDKPIEDSTIFEGGANLFGQANTGMNNFKNNSGNILGNQAIEQAKTAKNLLKNLGEGEAKLVDELMSDVKHPEDLFKR